MKRTLFFLLTLLTINLNAQVTDVLTIGLAQPTGLAISGNSLFIGEEGSNKISKIDISLAVPVKTDVVTGVASPDGLAISGTTLYIAEYDGGKISKIDISSPTPILTTVITGVMEPTGIAINGNDLYIAEYDAGKISKLDLTTLVITDFIDNLSGPTGLAISNNILYFSDFDDNFISKVDLTANVPVISQVISGLDEPAFLSVAGSELYIAQYKPGTLSKIDIANPVINDVATNLGGVYGLANNGTYLFFSQRDSNKISKIALPNLSTPNFDAGKRISIYPNPTSDFLTLDNVPSNSKIAISDVNGRIMKQFTYQKPTIDIQSLQKGIYFLTINKTETIKFIKN